MADVCRSVGKQPCWHQWALSFSWDDSPGVSRDLSCQTGSPSPPGDCAVVAAARSPGGPPLTFDVSCVCPEVIVIVTLNGKCKLVANTGKQFTF